VELIECFGMRVQDHADHRCANLKRSESCEVRMIGSRSESVSMNGRRVRVGRVVESRYSGGFRPLSWDNRKAGIDIVETIEGEVFRLSSSGQQSCPQPGWDIVLTSGDGEQGYGWTLYGLAPGAAVGDA